MKFTCLLYVICFYLNLQAQTKKQYVITRTETPPKIDAILDDIAWDKASIATDFIAFRPEIGSTLPKEKQTLVKMVYDDKAIYINAYLKDTPENITRQFTQRDDFGQSDFFAVIFNPNNDAQNDTEFFVQSSGTQMDAIANPSFGEDFGWNAVWESAVKIVDDGWIVELKIPYSALRFSSSDTSTWGLQFHRHFRKDRSQYTWNPINPNKGNIGLYHGELKGLKNLNPPTRLSFYPFISGIANTFENNTFEELSYGMDVKYGISDNFTLDATLIPDFSQVGVDNVTLNLGPFEQQFDEQRQFFKEGIDLFSKGDLFYSRRIGSAPTGNVTQNEGEVIDSPEKVNTLNAIKLSGRTQKGLGLGFFNAITEKTYAKVFDENTNDLKETVLVEPLTNYNIFVIDQQFNKNSSVSLINTNVTRNGHFRDANVTGLILDLANKNNTYKVGAQFKTSQLNLDKGISSGFNSEFTLQKTSGKYRFNFRHQLANKKFDNNDLGILFRNNFNNFSFNANYRLLEATEKFNSFNINVNFDYNQLFDPNTYTGNAFNINFFALTKHIFAFGSYFGLNIGKQHDYFDPRKAGFKFITKNEFNSSVFISTNYNKTIALDASIDYSTFFDKTRDYNRFNFEIEPRLKLNDKFLIIYNFEYDIRLKDRGFVSLINDNEDVIYGQRNRKTIENTIRASYNFNSFHALNLNFRNYWSTVNYENDLFELQNDGYLNQENHYTKTDIENPDVNYNIWNLDLSYSWQFAPGSLLTALYRNQLFNFSTAANDTYSESIETLFNSPIQHTFSLRMVYYIDYNNLKTLFKKKKITI